MSRCSYWTFCAALLATTVSWAADPNPEPAANPDEAAIRKAAQAYVDALNHGDGKAMLAIWSPEGEYIDATGKRVKAHEMIRVEFSEPRATQPGAEIKLGETTIRFVTPEVAIEDGTSPGGHFSAVWIKRDGKWLLTRLREYSAASAEPVRPLEQLSWLTEDWQGTSGDMTYEMSGRWTEGGHFIDREFSVSKGDTVLLHGHQIVGWDAASGTIRSWAFDSQGGHGDAIWTAEESGWIVDAVGFTVRGDEVSTTTKYTFNDDGTITWHVGSTVHDGSEVPAMTVKLSSQASK
jgi:uncharacterized protein (TIGR02246 family)